MATVDDAKGAVIANPGSSLAPSRIAPVRGLLKLLVRADASRSTLGRMGAWLILLAAFSALAFLGYLLPRLLW